MAEGLGTIIKYYSGVLAQNQPNLKICIIGLRANG